MESSALPPPSGKIHLSRDIPICSAHSVEVKMQAPAIFTSLKAFINSGSEGFGVSILILSLQVAWAKLTGMTDHPILLGDSPNIPRCKTWFPKAPCYRVLGCNLTILTVQ